MQAAKNMNIYKDILLKLAFSVQQNSGVYALLIGSGVSRSAGIPTGWEITLDLIKRYAGPMHVEPQEDLSLIHI